MPDSARGSATDAPAAPTPASERSGVMTLNRGLRILDTVAASPGPVGVNEIARQIGVHKSTVSRLCATLVTAGYLGRTASNQFILGPKLYQVAGVVATTVDLRSAARPALTQLVETCRETVSLTALEGRQIVTVDVVDGLDSVRMHSRVGSRAYLHASAGAKAILAFLPEEEAADLVAGKFPQLTPHTAQTFEELNHHLGQVRERGFSTDLEEIEIGLRCVGAPVRDHTGQVIAAVAVSGPRHRMTKDVLNRTGRVVMQTAASISTRLGAPVATPASGPAD